MATTAIWDVKDRLDRVINYAVNPDKTENTDFQSVGLQNVLDYTQEGSKTEHQFYVTGINCDPAIACEQMRRTKLQFQKTDGILAFHGYQAFAPGESDPETAHAIGVKLAQKLWGDRFEVIVSTHLDKQHLHNHFVLNSVSFMDGKRYYDNKATYALMRKVSDRLCREYSLSVIENPVHGKARHYAEWQADQEGKPTWRGLIRADVDKAVNASMTFSQFIAALREQGYEIKTGVKYMAVRPPGKERFVRLKTLGDDYIEEAIKQRILHNRNPRRPEALAEPPPKRSVFKGHYPRKVKKISGLRALYFHYLYRMGILPKHNASQKRTHFLLREDIRHMDTLIAQTRFLCQHRIDTKEQLSDHQSSLEQKMTELHTDRQSLHNRARRCGDEQQKAGYRKQIAGITKELSRLRKEVKLCTGILARSDELKQKLHRVRQEETQKRKAERTHESQRRCRPDRQHDT